MQENFMLQFSLPTIITNNSSYKNKMVHRSYTLQIPESPMLEAIYKEYLRNVLSLVKQKSSSFHILKKLQKYDSLNTNKIQVVSISLDTDQQKWKQAITNDKMPWLNFIDPTVKGNGFNGDLSQLFNI